MNPVTGPMDETSVRDRAVTVVGAARSGLAVAGLLVRAGAKVFLTERAALAADLWESTDYTRWAAALDAYASRRPAALIEHDDAVNALVEGGASLPGGLTKAAHVSIIAWKQRRGMLRPNLKIDRNSFYKIGSPEILQLFDGISRIISKKDPWRMETDNGIDGVRTIRNLTYVLDGKSENPADNVFAVHNDRIFFINIHTFDTHVRFENDAFYNYDLREPKRQIIDPAFIRETKTTVPKTNDWTDIPYYPTARERRLELVEQLKSAGKPVPDQLLQQIEQDKIAFVKSDSYNKSVLMTPPSQPEVRNHLQTPPARPPLARGPVARPPPAKAPPAKAPPARASARVGLGGVY
jgi:hypothetical protein